MSEQCCKTCDYWDIHSIDMLKGDCRAPDNHRYWRALMPPGKDGKRRFALLDAFGPEETKPNFRCGRWKNDSPSDLDGDPPSPQASVEAP